MEKIGKLRRSSTPKAGMVYWMAFSNPTRVVKPGHRVDVVIGSFRANKLIVESGMPPTCLSSSIDLTGSIRGTLGHRSSASMPAATPSWPS
jgi:hypothetical protein